MKLEDFKKERPDLEELFNSLSREDLIEQCWKEAFDAVKMEERVSVFMENCTLNMSKTNYTPASLKSMIRSKQEQDIIDFCDMTIEDSENDQEIADQIWQDSSKNKQ